MAQSTSGMVHSAIDSEQMVILAQPSASTDTPADFFTKLENTVVCSLVADLHADAVLASSQSSNATIKAISDNFQLTEISDSDRGLFSLETTDDVSEVSFGLLSKYDSSAQTAPDSNTYDIGRTSTSSSIKNVSVVNSSSIYDSNVQFEYSYNSDDIKSTIDISGAAYPTNLDGDIPNLGPWTASFDSANTNVNYNKAINSEYNNSGYTRPMKVEEHDTFNSTYALGMDLLTLTQHYYTIDADGKPVQNDIPTTGASSSSGDMSESYRLYDNGITAQKSADFESMAQSDLGSYRIQQFPDGPVITITEDGDENATSSQANISNFPIFNANANQTLPTNTLSMTQFNSMFNSSEAILAGYNYTVTLTEDEEYSGYSLNETQFTETDALTNPIFSLDNSSLKDNQVYMENYVNGSHTLSFDAATLAIEAVGNAVSQTNSAPFDVFALNTQREYIKQSDYHDGQIKINTATPSTRTTSIAGDLNVPTRVYYNAEGAGISRNGISPDLKINKYAAFLDQLVMQKSASVVGSFIKHNDVALDLYNGGIVNDNFNTTDFEFNATGKTTNFPAEVIRITPLKQLSSVKGFSNMDLSTVNGIYTFATLSNLKTIMSGANNVFDKSQMVFNLKKLAGSKIQTASATAQWPIVTSDLNGNLVSSSASAFSSDSTRFPSLELTKSLISNSVSGISFKISALTGVEGDATKVDHLRDEVKIEYWANENDKKELIIPQELLTKIPVGTDPSPEIGSVINISSNNLSGKLAGKTINVYPVTASKNYKYSFELPIRGFTGLTMTTPTITSTTTYHIIKDSTTNEQLPSSFHQYVNGGIYKNITEAFSAVSSVSGTFDKNDLCDMLMKVISKDTDGIEADRVLTETVSVSMYYGIEVKTNLTDANVDATSSIDGDITLRCESDYSNQENAEVITTLNNNNGYVLQLTNSYDANFSCEDWNADMSNIGSKTSIECLKNTSDYTDKRLTVQNGYSSIPESAWNNNYKVVVSYADNKATTILSVQNSGNQEFYRIKTKNYTYLNTIAYIANVVKDIHRVDSWIGASTEVHEFAEKFIQVDYLNNVFEIYTGIYLTVSSTSPFTQITNNGQYSKFSLKTDIFGVNLIAGVNSDDMFRIGYNGSITNHVVTNNGLSFQYNDGSQHVSRVLTIDRYRGFYGLEPTELSSPVVQVYTIKRNLMGATLTIARSSSNVGLPSSITQSWSVYAGDTVSSGSGAKIVDKLNNTVVGDIGLKITFYVSMLTDAETRSFPIYTRGDNVSFSISNPYSDGDYRTNSGSTTLKSFVLDTFGGSNYNGTTKPLSINSYRLKIKTQNTSNPFDNTSASWTIELQARQIRIYKNVNYLGNPVNIDTNDAYVLPNTSKWTDVTPISRDPRSNLYDFISEDGVTVNGWVFKRSAGQSSLPSISFFVLSAPYYKFSMIQSASNVLPCADSTTGLRSVYLPVVDNKVYNPFTATKTYTYSNGTTTNTVTNSQDVSNNVTFTNTTTDPVSLSSFITSSSEYRFVVEADKLTIKLRVGLKTQGIDQSIMTLFDEMPANRLMYNIQTSTPYFYKVELKYSNSGIQMKLFQPMGALTPYNGLTSQQIYSTQRGIDYNAVLNIDNFFVYPTSSRSLPVPTNNTFSLDLPTGNGNKVYMYTRETSVATNGDHVITVYRYSPISNLDYNDVDATGAPTLSSISAQYYTRSKKEFTLPISEFKTFISNSATELKTAFSTFVKNYATINFTHSVITDKQWSSESAWTFPDGTYNSAFFSVVCPSQQAMSTIPSKFFSVATSQSPSKAVYVTYPPLIGAFNKFGVPIHTVSAWGGVKTTSVSIKNLIVNSGYNTPVSNNMSNINKKTVLGHKGNAMSLA